MSSATDFITVTLVIIDLVVCVPLCMYFIYPMYKRRNELILKKRYVKLTLWAAFSMQLYLISTCIIQLVEFGVISKSSTQKIVTMIDFLLLSLSGDIFYAMIFFRIWLIYYDIKYNIIVATDEWKSIINYDNTNKQTSFFVKYKSTLGNEQFLTKIILIEASLSVIAGIIIATLDIINGTWNIFMFLFDLMGGIFACYMILCCIIYCKLRKYKFYDDFHIRKELYVFGRVLILCGIITTIFRTLFDIFRDYEHGEYSALAFIFGYIHYQIGFAFACLLIYILTRWVLNKLNNDCALQAQYGNPIHKPLNTHHHNHQDLASNSNPIDTDCKIKQVTLKQILETSEYIQSFMNHLSFEFSMELLLSLIEFIQWRQYMKQKIDEENDLIDKTENDIIVSNFNNNYDVESIELAECIPKSSIIYNNDYAMTDQDKAYKLYEKYIMTGAEYEINIHYSVRSSFEGRFQNTHGPSLLRRFSSVSAKISKQNVIDWDNNAMLGMFDECCEEMLKLLGYSYSRFKSKPEFLKMNCFEHCDN